MKFRRGSLNYKKYALIIIAPLFFIAMAIWVLESYFGILYGDLTRIGQLDEGDFGWHMHQPSVPAELLKSFPLNEADIAVIGDSFSNGFTTTDPYSNGLIWQSRLVSAGFKPATLKWDTFQPCSLGLNLGEVLRRAGFQGHYLVIENVEHGFQNRMQPICDISGNIKAPAYSVAAPQTDPPVKGSPIFANKEPLGGEWVINAFINKIRLDYLFKSGTSYMEFGDARTRVVPINGCKFFSNRLCNYGLFYSHDFEKETFSSMDKVVSINRDLQNAGIQAIWLVVPDKSTIYLGYGKFDMHPYVNVWNEFAQHPELVAPDLGEAFSQQSRLIKDFYKPDDVHLSTNGYLYLGDLMASLVRHLEWDNVKKYGKNPSAQMRSRHE